MAIAQSDNIVFVYKIGLEWGEKKSICNKFLHSCSITSLVWPSKKNNDIYYGLAEGVVKHASIKTHKHTTLYSNNSYVTAMSVNPQCSAFVSAHLDGSLYVYYMDQPDSARLIARHSSVPFALCWGSSIVVAGNDSLISFYDENGSEESSIDMSNSSTPCKEFTVAACNLTGDSVILGNFNALYTFIRNKDTLVWENKGTTEVENMYSVTAMSWKPDGDKLAVGSLCGLVDLYDICVKRTLYKGGFELTYVSHSQVIVRQIESNLRIVIRSQYGREILKTNIYKSRYVIANTVDTILLGDLETLKLSEIQWHGNGNEKYIFDNPSACCIYHAGEISIVEYGTDEALGSIRTSFTSSHVLSLRINERPPKLSPGELVNYNNDMMIENKKVAYLLDSQTIRIHDLLTHSTINIPHNSKIDWLELNARGNLLLFRDKRRHLYLFNTENQIPSQLLNYCTYVQWVPSSDVVVAQNRSNLCVWYNIHAPDQITSIVIKGDVEDIERSEGRTEVVVDEGISQAVYPLDESLISFGTAIDDNDYLKAMEILDNLIVTPDVESMWRQLYDAAIAASDLAIAQRCAAAVGDISMSKYLGELIEICHKAEQEIGIRGTDHYLVRCKLCLINRDFKGAEIELLNQGKVDDCIEMYQKFMKHEEAIRVAEQCRHPEALEMRQAYFQYLLDSNQDEKAAELKLDENDFLQAINLFLKAGMPGKAAQVIIDKDIQQPLQTIDNVANALTRASMHEKAGDLYEILNDLPRSLECYIRGNAFNKAVRLARKCFPVRVVELQEQWGDYLVSQKQVDMAINHYIEAKVYNKAIEAALNARQYSRAQQLVDAIDSESAIPYYKQLARYYDDARNYELAEKCYVAAKEPQLAVEMYSKLGHWETSHKIAMTYMSEQEVALLYIGQAQKLESKGKLKEAERLYLAIKEKDLAINMYKKNKRFEDMIRLVSEHRSDLLKETHQYLAQTLEMEGNLKDAEHHYIEAQEWHSAVNMYRSNEQWDDAIRVSKYYGGINACKRVTMALIMAVGVPEGSKYLTKHGLVEAAIDHATENGAFDIALELSELNMPKKLPDIHLKYALFLEDDERFEDAEVEFIKANKPKEAIDMYVHQQDWANAIRVAEKCEPVTIPEIYIAHANAKIACNDFAGAEELFISASRPDLALQMYQEQENWPEANRVAETYLPHRATEIKSIYQASQVRAGKGGNKNDFLGVGRSLEQSKKWDQAIDVYLNANKDKVHNISDLEAIWEKAIDIAREYVPNRQVEVSVEVANRLVNINREESAADILVDVGRLEEAINICLNAKKYEKAKILSKGNNALRKKVDEAYQGYLISNEDTKELVEIGHSDVAIEVLVKRGEWDKVWKVAAKENLSNATVGKYVIMCVEELLKKNTIEDVNEAVRLLSTKPNPTTDSALTTYRKLVQSVLGRTNEQIKNEKNDKIVELLRDVLFNIVYKKSSNADKKFLNEVYEMLMATHYVTMMTLTKSCGLTELYAKTCITQLKYPQYIPSDKAFYQAGMACREAKNINLAFLLLNRYVDISEAIDAEDVSLLDGSDLMDADGIPPQDYLPSKHFLESEDDREDVRTWVLSVVTDSSIEQRLPPRESTRNTLYEGLFYTDKQPLCVVTGFPIHPSDLLEVNNSTANRRDWNNIVSKTRTCPWTGKQENPLY